MSSELNILALYGILVIVTIVIQVLLAIPQLGLQYLASARDDERAVDGVPGRALRCVQNSVVAMALLAPAILILDAKGNFTADTLFAAQIFLVVRLLYVPLYLVGTPWLRTGVWMVGALATLWLYLMAF